MQSILVYCGSRSGYSELYKNTAKELGKLLAEHNYKLIYGGGNVGLMGVLSNAMLEHNGYVVGVMPKTLIGKEIANKNCTELIIVENMQDRKVLMEKMADVIVTLPGGFGTMDELFESLTNRQIGIHSKPTAILNINGVYNHIIAQIDTMVQEGFVSQANKDSILICNSAKELVQKLSTSLQH